MKQFFLFIVFFICVFMAKAQTDEPKYKNLIGLDVTGLFGNPNPGIGYLFETQSLQARAHFQYGESTSSDSSNKKTTSTTFVPSIGAAWIVTHDNFSFYAGCDFYYKFNSTKYSYSVSPVSASYKYYGFSPTIGFRFPIHKRFFFGVEVKSDGQFTEGKYNVTGKSNSYFSFSLLDKYGINLFYRL